MVCKDEWSLRVYRLLEDEPVIIEISLWAGLSAIVIPGLVEMWSILLYVCVYYTCFCSKFKEFTWTLGLYHSVEVIGVGVFFYKPIADHAFK